MFVRNHGTQRAVYLFALLATLGLRCLVWIFSSWACGCHSWVQYWDFASQGPLLLWSTGLRHSASISCGTWAQWLLLLGSRVVSWVDSCSATRGIFPDQGSNLCPLHWQMNSYPLQIYRLSGCLPSGRLTTPTHPCGYIEDHSGTVAMPAPNRDAWLQCRPEVL